MRRVSVAIKAARASSGAGEPPLYQATLGGEPYVVWEIGGGELRAARARCPHRPQRPVLHLRGSLDRGRLVCGMHGNAYDHVTGECVWSPGPDRPGRLEIVKGWRDGDRAVLLLPEDASC